MKTAHSIYALRKLHTRAVEEEDQQSAQALSVAVLALEHQHVEGKQQQAAHVKCIPVARQKVAVIGKKLDPANITSRLAKRV